MRVSHDGLITVGVVHAGTAVNIIPDEAVIEGTIRTLSAERRADMVVILKASDGRPVLGIICELQRDVRARKRFGIFTPSRLAAQTMPLLATLRGREVLHAAGLVVDQTLRHIATEIDFDSTLVAG